MEYDGGQDQGGPVVARGDGETAAVDREESRADHGQPEAQVGDDEQQGQDPGPLMRCRQQDDGADAALEAAAEPDPADGDAGEQ